MKFKAEIIWIILAILSIFAFLLSYLKLFSSFFAIFLVISTFIKGLLISDYFMGLRDIEYKYRLIPILWLIVVFTLIVAAYDMPQGAF